MILESQRGGHVHYVWYECQPSQTSNTKCFYVILCPAIVTLFDMNVFERIVLRRMHACNITREIGPVM